ncbi:cytochrome c oxidase subunit II [Gaiella sp.]|uniref:cytochrome c oxidase subunit II n=1 Tax=Gaiella sp. TaxID=2663207 RepID=UPI002E37D302|nr:cytochrome c oxidase subunit II [Gaiella sp.]HEX5583406.1 cytochrome c oxidase subunit II [Gaiella sp.]
MVRRAALLKMLAIAAVAAVITTLVAVLIRWLPPSASEQMDRITFTYWFATIICIGIFSLVIGAIVYSVIAFRAQPDDDTDGPPIHGNTRLEIAWTVVPAILVIAIGIVSAVVLSKNADAGRNPLHVKVFAQQFAWRFEYPGGVRTDELVMPVHRGVKFEMTSADVIHSFWVPQFGQKQDVLPGVTTSIVVTPTKTGRYTLICTELCGLGHATMRAPVRVIQQAAFNSWLSKQQAASGEQGGGATTGGTTTGATTTGGGGANEALGSKVFASSGCGACHTLTKTGSDGQVGPKLDDLAPAAQKAGKSVGDYVRQSIVDPNAVVVSGYQPNVMPQTFGQSLSKDELNALVDYVSGEEAQ